ncbi:MAG: hypothetical protein WBD40_22150 [Tepidisphaeraceae bacterium]
MCQTRPPSLRSIVLPAVLVAAVFVAAGCVSGPTVIVPDKRTTIDRKLVEYPARVQLQEIARELTGPVDCAVDAEGNLIVAESGRGGYEPRIYAIRKNGTTFDIYPTAQRFPFLLSWIKPGHRIYGPVGGIAVDAGRVYVSHRDEDGYGVITAFTYDGKHTTIVGKLPAQGDYGMGDIAIEPITGRLWFGVGAATNSGVVGLDNWAAGWVKHHENFSDRPWTDLKLLGYRFDTPNPLAGLFGGKDVAGTAPFQPFNSRYRGRIPKAPNGRPTAAVFSCDPGGGGLKVEAHGIRYPRGIAFNAFGSPFVTNNGMELRGTRPVQDDPDVLLRVVSARWYGWPDYSADLRPIAEARNQPPRELLVTYTEGLTEVIDHRGSGLESPYSFRRDLVNAVFPPLAGAAGVTFVPDSGPLEHFEGHAIVALSGDRAPFATSGRKMKGPTGYRIVRVDNVTQTDSGAQEVSDFVRNTAGVPRSRQRGLTYHDVCLERPIAVKFDLSDGSMYIVDFGVLEMRKGREFVKAHTGRIFKLVPAASPSTQPAPSITATTPAN